MSLKKDIKLKRMKFEKSLLEVSIAKNSLASNLKNKLISPISLAGSFILGVSFDRIFADHESSINTSEQRTNEITALAINESRLIISTILSKYISNKITPEVNSNDHT